MMHRIPSIVVMLVGLAGPDSRAEVILSVTDARLFPGGSAVVDVRIAGEGVATLDVFSIVVRASPAAGGRRLECLPPGIGSATDGQLTDQSYLFAGNSLFAGGTAGIVSSEQNPSDDYVGGDGTTDGLGVFVPMSSTLLTRLELTALSADAPRLGDRFEGSLDLADPRTTFLDASFSPLSVRSTGVGTVLVIPEPPGLALSGMGIAAAFALASLRRLACRSRPLRDDRDRHRTLLSIRCGHRSAGAPGRAGDNPRPSAGFSSPGTRS